MATAPDLHPPEDTFVMTTWHDDDSIEDTLDFMRWNTSFDNYESENFSIVIIGNDPELQAAIEASLKGLSL